MLQLVIRHLRKHVVHKVPADSAVTLGISKIVNKKKAGDEKIMDIAYFIPLKRRLLINFKDHIGLKMLHKVMLDSNSYENETACWELIKTIACYLFDEDVQKNYLSPNKVSVNSGKDSGLIPGGTRMGFVCVVVQLLVGVCIKGCSPRSC